MNPTAPIFRTSLLVIMVFAGCSGIPALSNSTTETPIGTPSQSPATASPTTNTPDTSQVEINAVRETTVQITVYENDSEQQNILFRREQTLEAGQKYEVTLPGAAQIEINTTNATWSHPTKTCTFFRVMASADNITLQHQAAGDC